MGVFISRPENRPSFHWDHEKLSRPLAALRYRQGRWLGRMESLEEALRREAAERSLTTEVLASIALDGKNPRPEKERPMATVILDATQYYSKPLTEERLSDWRNALSSSTVASPAVKSSASSSLRLAGPPPSSAEMKMFLKWFNREEDIDPVIKAAVAHWWFAHIHSGEEGRMIARAVTAMQLARAEHSDDRYYSLFARILKEKDSYLRLLVSQRKKGKDITDWLEWFLACLDRALADAEEMLETVLKKALFRDRQKAQLFNDRQRQMINALLDGPENPVTTSTWARANRCSQDTALRDIQDLMDRGILLKEAAGGRSTHYILAE